MTSISEILYDLGTGRFLLEFLFFIFCQSLLSPPVLKDVCIEKVPFRLVGQIVFPSIHLAQSKLSLGFPSAPGTNSLTIKLVLFPRCFVRKGSPMSIGSPFLPCLTKKCLRFI
jgi:hypothetical protein